MLGRGLGPFSLARWERSGRLFRWFGVGVFRWILLHTHLRWLTPNLELKSGRSDLDRLQGEMGSAEATHAVGAVVAFATAAVHARLSHGTIAIWLILLTFPFHVYPVMLQRWNRGRILGLRASWGGRTQENRSVKEH
jgi:hypothetical protein